MAEQQAEQSKNRPAFVGKALSMLPSSPFARSFVETIVAGILILILFGGWITLRSDRTAEILQAKIPTKAATIEASSEQAETPKAEIVGEGTGHIAATPLPPAPIAGLTEPYEQGFLPMARAEDELTPFEAYRRPFEAQSGKAQVSIVIVDFGLSESLSQSLLNTMPADVTFALTPYADDVQTWGARAREAGHEFWMSLPMETQGASAKDTGPLTILLNTSLDENRKRLFAVMSAATGYAGLVSQEKHAFIKSDMDVSPMMKQVFGRGLAFAESNPGIPAYGLSMAMEFAYPYVQNTFWLDASLRPADIDRAIQTMERQALSKGRAVAFVHPYPVAIRKIGEWIESTPDKNIQLAPLSAMVR